MSHDALKVLLVEDNPADAHLIQKYVAAVPYIALSHVECLNEAIHCLKTKSFDAILLDLSLPDSRGLNTVKHLHTEAPKTPLLVLTGLDDEELAMDALREGAQDYLVKGEIQTTWLIRALHYAIERQQTVDQLQHLNNELSRSNEELEHFAHVVSHDLRQPLQGILGFAQILTMSYADQLDESANRYIDHIVSASKHMARLIQDLLDYSIVGRAETSSQSVDCNDVLERVISALQPSINESNAVIRFDELPTIHGNDTLLVQLFQNLLSNAIKYHSPQNTPCVNISVENKAHEWLFGVHDNGIGIETNHFDQVFQIFKRLPTKDQYPGTGIGLSTCKKIVESYGGRIWLESKIAEGTAFYFTWPIWEGK